MDTGTIEYVESGRIKVKRGTIHPPLSAGAVAAHTLSSPSHKPVFVSSGKFRAQCFRIHDFLTREEVESVLETAVSRGEESRGAVYIYIREDVMAGHYASLLAQSKFVWFDYVSPTDELEALISSPSSSLPGGGSEVELGKSGGSGGGDGDGDEDAYVGEFGYFVYYRWMGRGEDKVQARSSSITCGGTLPLSRDGTRVFLLDSGTGPHGAGDKYEHALETAIRETREETGLEIDTQLPIRYVFGQSLPAARQGGINDNWTFFTATVVDEDAVQLDLNEVSGGDWYSIQSIVDTVKASDDYREGRGAVPLIHSISIPRADGGETPLSLHYSTVHGLLAHVEQRGLSVVTVRSRRNPTKVSYV